MQMNPWIYTSVWMDEIQTNTFSKDCNALLQMHRKLWWQIDAETGLNRLICYADCTASSMNVCMCVYVYFDQFLAQIPMA